MAKTSRTNKLQLSIPVPTTSLPGITGSLRAPTLSSRTLDVRFYTTPNTPPNETSDRPYCPDEGILTKLQNQEALATDLMKELIREYETRDKGDKFSYQDALEHDRRTRRLNTLIKLCGPKIPRCAKAEEEWAGGIPLDYVLPSAGDTENADPEADPEFKDEYWTKIFDRPSTTVTQSAFAAVLEAEVNAEIVRCGCPAPVYKFDRLYDDLRLGHISMDAILLEPENNAEEYVSARDSMEEPEEKLIARLKIYRRAMCSLIHHFKSLRPILSAIMRNYDGMIGLRDRQMHDIQLIKRNMGFTERQFDIRLAEVSAEGYYQLCEAEKRCFLLLRHVDKQDAAMRTMTEILNNLESSLEEEIQLKNVSEDKRKKLIMEINDLRRQINESARILGQDAALQAAAAAAEEEADGQGAPNEDDLNSSNDSSIIRTALENTRKTLSDAQWRVTVLEADYSDVIPKKDFEALEVVMKEAEKKHKACKDDFDTLSSEVQGLKDQTDSLIADRDDLLDLVADLKFKSTPRPSWSKIAEFVEGGLSRWQEIYQGKSSKEIVDQVVEVLTGKKVGGPPEFLEIPKDPSSVPGSGDTQDRSRPSFLVYDESRGPIRNRHFTRREAATIVHDITQFRIEQVETIRKLREKQDLDDYGAKDDDTQIPSLASFPDYFLAYFSERFPWPELRDEWLYNLLDACRRFPNENQLSTFLGILEGRVDECLIHVLRSDIAQVRNVLLEKSTLGNHPVGSIPAGEFPAAMAEAFPQKTDEEIQLLTKAAAKQTGAVADWYQMKYMTFFVMTDEGLTGDFIEQLIRQFEQDRLEYVYEILNVLLSELGVSLQSAERENDPAGETDVSMPQIYNAISTVDPLLPEEKMAAAIAWIFFGETTLPGMQSKGLLLVRYIQETLRRNPNADPDSDEEDDGDLADFERAVEEVRKKEGGNDLDNEEVISEKKRRAALKRLRVAPLRMIFMRLKGGCLFRYGKKVVEKPGSPVENLNPKRSQQIISGGPTNKGQTGTAGLSPSYKAK